MAGRQEARPVGRRASLDPARRIGQDEKRGQVLVLGPQAVADPASQARLSHQDRAGVDLVNGLGVIDAVGPARADHREVVGAVPEVRQEVGDRDAALTALAKRPASGEQRVVSHLAPGGHRPEAGRQRLARQALQIGLGVERLEMARAAMHEQVDHAPRPGWKMRSVRCQRVRPPGLRIAPASLSKSQWRASAAKPPPAAWRKARRDAKVVDQPDKPRPHTHEIAPRILNGAILLGGSGHVTRTPRIRRRDPSTPQAQLIENAPTHRSAKEYRRAERHHLSSSQHSTDACPEPLQKLADLPRLRTGRHFNHGRLNNSAFEKFGATSENGRLVTLDVDFENLDRSRDSFQSQVLGEIYRRHDIPLVGQIPPPSEPDAACFPRRAPARQHRPGQKRPRR